MKNNTSGDVLKKEENTLHKTLIDAASNARKEALKSEAINGNATGFKSILSDVQKSCISIITAKTDLLYNEYNDSVAGYGGVW